MLSERAQWLLAGNLQSAVDEDAWINSFGKPIAGASYLITHHHFGNQELRQSVGQYIESSNRCGGFHSHDHVHGWIKRVVSWRLLVGQTGLVEGYADGLLVEPRNLTIKRPILEIPREWMEMDYYISREDEASVRDLVRKHGLQVVEVSCESDTHICLNILFQSARQVSVFRIEWNKIRNRREALMILAEDTAARPSSDPVPEQKEMTEGEQLRQQLGWARMMIVQAARLFAEIEEETILEPLTYAWLAQWLDDTGAVRYEMNEQP
jgi:hypothetical protein